MESYYRVKIDNPDGTAWMKDEIACDHCVRITIGYENVEELPDGDHECISCKEAAADAEELAAYEQAQERAAWDAQFAAYEAEERAFWDAEEAAADAEWTID